MGAIQERLLEILRANHGFSEPERWIDFAIREKFERVAAQPVPSCPGCGAAPTANVLGQYVHYSTLMRLVECACGLIWSDAQLPPEKIAEHFERTYKDEDYFQRQRAPIFDQLAELIEVTPQGGSVIDIGGGKGHLMDMVRRRRPDLKVSVTDLSTDSVTHCRKHYDIPASAGSLLDVTGKYDTVVLSDVLYYEDRIREAWKLLGQIGRTVIIRGPNKLERIRARCRPGPMQVAIPNFNPEHRFILSRRYVERSLSQAGFSTVRTVPSAALKSLASPLVDRYSWLRFHLTGAIVSPSMITIGRRA